MIDTVAGKIPIGLVQFNANYSGQSYLPLSIGCLWSNYTTHGRWFGSFELSSILYKRQAVDECVAKLLGNKVVGFSLYAWNEQLSLAVAKQLKSKDSSIIIFAGGPQIPDSAEEWLIENNCIDVVVHGEGEIVFSELVDMFFECDFNLLDNRFREIAGISYFENKAISNFVSSPPRPRNRDLELSSPFIDGFFDRVMQENPEERWMALWETNRGCPFSCTFCDWGSAINAKISKFDMSRITLELQWIASAQIEFVFICDANFGILPRDVDIAREIVRVNSDYEYPKRVSTQSTKNVTERAFEVQCLLSNAGVSNGATLSMQSIFPDTLKAIKRQNISLSKYFELQTRFKAAKVPTYVDLILGLPEETLSSFKDGVSTLLELGQHDHIQFNNLSLLPNAEMNNKEEQLLYGFEILISAPQSLHGLSQPDTSMPLEIQKLVVGTNTLKSKDWVEARAFAWMTSFIHLNKIAQLPILLCRSISDLKYDKIISDLMNSDSTHLGELSNFFRSKATHLQTTGEEYVSLDEYLGINWQADEYAFIDMVKKETLSPLLSEVIDHLNRLTKQLNTSVDTNLIEVAFSELQEVSLNWLMLPAVTDNFYLELKTNSMEVCEKQIAGEKIELIYDSNVFKIERTSDPEFVNLDFLEWCKKVVWYRNKRGAYNYEIHANIGLPEGHYR